MFVSSASASALFKYNIFVSLVLVLLGLITDQYAAPALLFFIITNLQHIDHLNDIASFFDRKRNFRFILGINNSNHLRF